MATGSVAPAATKGLRILMVPVTRSSWSLSLCGNSATAIALGSETAAGQVGQMTSAASSRLTDAAARRSPAMAQATARRTESVSQRVAKRMRKVIDDAGRTWERLADAKSTSLRGRIYAAGNALQDRIDDREFFLRSISATPPHNTGVGERIRLVAPSSLDSSDAVAFIRRLAREGIDRHRRWFQISCSFVPLSVLFAVVPGPNLPLFWNGYRVLSHWNAWNGALSLQRRIGYHDAQNMVEVETDDTLDDLAEISERQGRLDDHSIARAADYFVSPDMARSLRRVRFQVEHLNSRNFRIQR